MNKSHKLFFLGVLFLSRHIVSRKLRRESEYHPTFQVRSVARPTTFQKLCLRFPQEGDGDGSVTSKASLQKVFHILGILRAFFNPTQALGFLFSGSWKRISYYTLKIGSKTRLSVDPFSLKPSKKKNAISDIKSSQLRLPPLLHWIFGRKEGVTNVGRSEERWCATLTLSFPGHAHVWITSLRNTSNLWGLSLSLVFFVS